MHVLLVEDDPLVASGIEAGLKLHGLTIDHVCTASQADTALALSHFDVCILDLGLPDEDGMELLCRSEEHTSELQSLMRISYAVFCLKKKTQKQSQPALQRTLYDKHTLT